MKILLIVLTLSVIFVAGVLYKVFGPSVKRNTNEKIILKGGVTSQARVISIMDTGGRQERHPEMNFKLEVSPESGKSFEIEVTTFVSVYQLANLVPGSIVTVKYDPKYPNSAVLLK